MRVHVVDHPLARHHLGTLRDVTTQPSEFRLSAQALATVVLYHATFDLESAEQTIKTPIEDCNASFLKRKVVIVPILRAGDSMVESALRLFPDISIGYLGLERSHETAQAHRYYMKVPDLKDRTVICVDPMLATGGSASQAIDALKSHGGESVRLATIVAAPEGVERVNADHPDVAIYTIALDRELNEQKYIMPGLGDFGDRYCDTE